MTSRRPLKRSRAARLDDESDDEVTLGLLEDLTVTPRPSRENQGRTWDDDDEQVVGESLGGTSSQQDIDESGHVDQTQEGSRDSDSVQPTGEQEGPDADPSSLATECAREREIEDAGCPAYLSIGFKSVDLRLRNIGIYKHELPLETFNDEHNLLSLSREYERTMDSVSKSFQLIPTGDQSIFMQPYEGYPLCYMERCNSMNTPPHIGNVIYFYFCLMNHLKTSGLTGYVLPLENLRPMKPRGEKKIIGIFEYMNGCDEVDESTESQTMDFSRLYKADILSFLSDREKSNGSDHKLERDPFTIRIAFTGAFFEVDGVTKQELFCIAIITPNKSFDMISYIKDFFSAPPRSAQAKETWCHLDLCYKKIQMFEANNNCGLMCDPVVYKNDIGGKGGVLSMMCLLNLPLRMQWVIRNLRPDQDPQNIRIIGLPKLSFRNDGTMEGYIKYMHTYINGQVEIFDTFQNHVKVFNSASESEQEILDYEIKSPGGWPLQCCIHPDKGHQLYQRFGLFEFPLIMKFDYQKFVERPSRESFLLNMGSEPESVMKKKRDFATFDPTAGASSVMSDSAVLLSKELATPLGILDKYYGPNAKPADDFKDTKLIKWFEATKMHVQSLLIKEEITPDEAMIQVKRHIESCMEQHACIVKHDGYGSVHFQQCGKVVDSMLDTKLARVRIQAYQADLKETVVPPSIRHDAFQSASFCMTHSWFKYNQFACLYATNAEAALEIFLSSMLWHLGSHSHTMVSFFQGCLLISQRGHLEVMIDKHSYIDWRKPNSSGAGAIQDRLNKYMEELGRVFKIMPDSNKLVFINPNRNTMAALENECCVITVNTSVSEVKSKPSPQLKDMPLLMLENRGDYSLDTLLRFVFPRDAVQRNVALTTMDLDKTNDRSVALKEQICNPNVSGFCTNQKKGTDEPKTLICVTHVCDPGAPAYYEITEQSGEINRVQCELNDGRATMPKDNELYVLLKQIFFSKIFTSVMVALPHRAGMLPFHINTTSSSFLDWMYMIVRSHLFCIFNVHMIENFGRIKDGYEYRHVGWSVWIRSTMCMAKSEEDLPKAAKEAALACAHDALPVTEAVSVMHSVLRRCIDGGWLSMVGCLIQALRVPIVPVDDLCDFFKSSEEKGCGMSSCDTLDEGIPDCMQDKIELELSDEDNHCNVENWGEFAEMDCPTNSVLMPVDDVPEVQQAWQPPSVLQEPQKQQEQAASQGVETDSISATIEHMLSRMQRLEAKSVDCEQALVRYGILFEGSVGRLDDGVQRVDAAQKQSWRQVDDLKRQVHAISCEVGVERVQARMEQQRQEQQQRQQRQFGAHGGQGGTQGRQHPPAGFYEQLHKGGRSADSNYSSRRGGGRGGRGGGGRGRGYQD